MRKHFGNPSEIVWILFENPLWKCWGKNIFLTSFYYPHAGECATALHAIPLWFFLQKCYFAAWFSTDLFTVVVCVASINFLYKELFCFLPTHKLEREKKIYEAGGGEEREGMLTRNPLWFWKTCLPTNGASDWSGVAILIDKCIKFAWLNPGIIRMTSLPMLWGMVCQFVLASRF